MFDAIITDPFGAYAVGQRVCGEEVDALLDGSNHAKMVKVPAAEPVGPVPEPDAIPTSPNPDEAPEHA